jgi:hypothetical protein
MDNNGENLKKVPECGIVDFKDKTKSIPENTLVSTLAKREYQLSWMSENWSDDFDVHKMRTLNH